MNFLFRLFVFVGGLFVLALFAALVAPYFINWDKFTVEFEEQASKVVGQEVRVGGKTNLRLLPLPFLSFEDLQVGRNSDGSPLMTVEQFAFNAELLPFLTGEVRIVEMSMRKPRVNLQVSEDGAIAWTNPKEFLVNPEQVNIEKLNIEDGSILISGLIGERKLELENIQGDLNAKSILGPWRIDATADVEDISSEIKIATGTFQDDGSMRLKMDVNRTDQPYNLLLDGPVKLENNTLSWNGKFKASPFSKLQVAEMETSIGPLPIFSEGTYVATPKRIDVTEYRLDVGSRDDPYTITGQGVVSIDNEVYFKVQADGRQIDVDQLKQTKVSGEKTTLENRLAAFYEILKRVPVPTGNGEIDVLLPAIVAGDTFIRDVKTIISPSGQGWAVKSLKAILPGNTAFEANGRLGLQNGFGFSGKVLIASRQPSGFADWVSGNVDETFRRLKSVGLSADLTVSTRQALLENVELRLDDALLRGKLQRLASNEGRPALVAELKGNRVNVDDLSAIYSLTQVSGETTNVHDINIKIKADVFEAMVGGKPFTAEGVAAQVQVREGTISIERLNAQNLLGANIVTTGRIENILSKPNGNMKLKLQADNAVKLLEFSNQFFGQNSFIENLKSSSTLTQNTTLNIELDTSEYKEGAKGKLLVNGSLGGSNLDLQVGFTGKLDDSNILPLVIDGSLFNQRPSVLMQQVGIKTLPTDVYGEIPGDLKMDFGLSGTAKDGFDSTFSFLGEKTALSASGEIKTDDWNNYNADLKITLGSEDFAPVIRLLDIPIPNFSADKAIPVSTSFNVKKSKSDFEFANLKGQVSSNQFSGNLTFKQELVARPRISGDLVLGKIDLSFITEAVFGRATKLGNSLGLNDTIAFDENSIFGEMLFSGLDASISISTDTFNLVKGFVGEGAKFKVAMLDGAINLDDLSFSLLDGQVDGGINLKNTAGSVLANVNYSVRGVDIEKLIKELNMDEFVSGAITLNGSAETTGQNIRSLISNLSGSGFVAMKEGQINGINVNALAGILSASSAEGYEITSEKTKALFIKNALTSKFIITDFDTPFSINRGKLRSRNINYSVGKTFFKSDIEIDLQTNNLEATTDIKFTPDRRNAISGADPYATLAWVGPITSLEKNVDIGRLEGYLSLRAFEISQKRLETLEAQLIEKQRLRGQIAYTFAREKYEERQAKEAKRLDEARKLREAEEAKRQANARKQKEAEAAKVAEQKRLAKLKAAQKDAARKRNLEQSQSPRSGDNFIKSIQDFLNAN